MKLIAFILFSIVISNALGKTCTGHYFESVQKRCAAANGGSRELLERFLNVENPVTENEKCFYACELLGCDLMTESGGFVAYNNINYPKMLSPNDPDRESRLANAYATCAQITPINENRCTTASNYIECLNIVCHDCEWNLRPLLKIK